MRRKRRRQVKGEQRTHRRRYRQQEGRIQCHRYGSLVDVHHSIQDRGPQPQRNKLQQLQQQLLRYGTVFPSSNE